MKSLVMLLSLFLSTLSLFAAEKGMYIIVSTYSSQQGAQEELERLRDAMMGHEEIRRLQESDGFTYALRPVGKYTRVVIQPFAEGKTFRTVLRTVVKHYPDAYIGGHRSVRSRSDLAGATAKEPAKITREELRIRVDSYLEENLPIVPYFPQSYNMKKAKEVGDNAFQEVSSAMKERRPVTSSAAEETRRSDADSIFMVIVGIAIIIIMMLISFLLSKRSKKKKRTKVSLQDFSDKEIPDIPQYVKP